ncbi:MAG: DUF4238 domain-containing protein [Parvibaculum sp.]
MSLTRRQHYVWRHYLEGWASNGAIAVVRRDGPSFMSNPANIGQQRDFYRLPYLSAEDEIFAEKMINAPGTNESLVKLNMGWLDSFAGPSRLRRLLETRGVTDETLEKAICAIEIQTEEYLHSQIEGPAAKFLIDLRAGDSSFWETDADAQDFAFFISLQHFRTKAMRERVLSKTDSRFVGHAARIWPILRLVFATNLGWSLYSERKRWHIRVLSALGNVRFITGDQPIVNLFSQPVRHDDLAMYYPISPDRAALLELRGASSPIGSDDQLDEATVEDLNRKIVKGSHEQAFGSNLDYLQRLMCNT